MANILSLPIAVRVYPDLRADSRRSDKPWKRPGAMLVWDTETRVDATQRLIFGNYRFIVGGQCLEEGLFYADDLSHEECRILEQYASTNTADAFDKQLHLRTRHQFIDILYRTVYKSRCLCIGFNCHLIYRGLLMTLRTLGAVLQAVSPWEFGRTPTSVGL